MDVQTILSRFPRLQKLMMDHVPPPFFERIGERKALKTFHRAAREIPAYRAFLQAHKVEPERVKTIGEFRDVVPATDKASYIAAYPFDSRLPEGSFLERCFTVFSSSGATGKPTYWPQEDAELERMVAIVRQLFRDVFRFHERQTLVVNTLALGMWGAGRIVMRMCDALAADKKHFKVISVSPGLNIENTIAVIRDIGDRFAQVMLCGYPPFLKKLLDEGERQGLEWPRYRLSFLIGGELVSEGLREYLAEKSGFELDAGNLERILVLYAASDGIVAPETRFSIAIRRAAAENRELAEALFGVSAPLPSLVQYAPMGNYVEQKGDGFLITKWSTVPLLRYDIHDRGVVIPFTRMSETLHDFGITPQSLAQRFGYREMPVLPFPFLAVFGRRDAIQVSGANVFIDHVAEALEDARIRSAVTGLFTMESREVIPGQSRMVLTIEVRRAHTPSEPLLREIRETVIERLTVINSEYRIIYETSPEAAIPVVELIPQGENVFLSGSIKNRFFLR